jgi:uncharacterized protein with ATP-grasp and redox domains
MPFGDFLFIEADVNGNKLSKIIYFPDSWKNIPWPANPRIKLEIIRQVQNEDHWISEVKVKTDKFVRLCHILLKSKYESKTLPVNKEMQSDISDNYFDLSAGNDYTVILSSAKKLTSDDLYVGHWWTEWE